MKNSDPFSISSQKIEFTLFQDQSDSEKLSMKISYLGNYSAHINIVKSDFLARRGNLEVYLANFIRRGSIEDLWDLAYAGYGTFKVIDDALKEQNKKFYEIIWKKDILNSISVPGKLLTKISNPNKILEINFPADFSFHFGLLFPREPTQKDWGRYSKSELLQVFFDLRFTIINKVGPWLFEKGIIFSDQPLKNGKDITALHAIDSSLPVSAIEKASLHADAGLKRIEAENLIDLVRIWKTHTPRIVLFSTHYSEDPVNIFSFKMTQDSFTNHHLIRIGDVHDDDKALLFLNCCNTGNVPGQRITNIFSKLYPHYALGFITTGYELRNKDAHYFPDKFFQIFMKENSIISDAFVKTKHYLIFQLKKPCYAALGYMLWQVNPELRYAAQPLKMVKNNKLKKNKSKWQKNKKSS